MSAGENDPGRRHTKSARMWDGTWDDLTRLGKDEGFAPSTLVGDTADLLAGYIRCGRCWGTPVPVTFGDLTGRPLREWAAEAERAVRYQRCKAHEPVTIGAEAPAAPAAAKSVRFMEPATR